MRWRLILALGTVMGCAFPSCCSQIYKRGFRATVSDCVLEAYRAGFVDMETAIEWAPDDPGGWK